MFCLVITMYIYILVNECKRILMDMSLVDSNVAQMLNSFTSE